MEVVIKSLLTVKGVELQCVNTNSVIDSNNLFYPYEEDINIGITGLDSLIDSILDLGIYETEYLVKKHISNNIINAKISISYLLKNDNYKKEYENLISCNEDITEDLYTKMSYVEFIYDYNTKYSKRYEHYGDFSYHSTEIRKEEFDYQFIAYEKYKVGDIVKLKSPIYGENEVIILSQPTNYNYNVYCVGYVNNDELFAYDDGEVHHIDIDKVIKNDKSLANKLINYYN